MSKKLTIIIPAYNCSRYIERCLDSIFMPMGKKDIGDIEVIVINDGSTDSTLEILLRYPRGIRIINTKNCGVSHARNLGIEKTNGKFLMFVDADDILDKHWLSAIKKYLDTPEYDVVYFSKYIKRQYSKSELAKNIAGCGDMSAALASACSRIYRASFLKQNSITLNGKIINGEDMLFNMQALRYPCNFRCAQKSFYRYRIYDGSSTKTINNKIIESDKAFHRELNKIIPSLKIPPQDAAHIVGYCLSNSIPTLLLRLSRGPLFGGNKSDYIRQLYDVPYRNASISFLHNPWLRLEFILYRLHLCRVVVLLLKLSSIKTKRIKERFITI